MAAELLARVRAEIEGRLDELRPAVAEYERLLGAADALESSVAENARPVAHGPSTGRRRGARAAAAPGAQARRHRPRMGAVEQAIVAALEHGSHTLSELGVVTALPAPALRDSVRRLLSADRIARTRREGRAAYSLSDSE